MTAPRSGVHEETEVGSRQPTLLQALVLAAIVKRQSYGYEIFERLNRVCIGFLKIHRSVVYDAIDWLARQHLIQEAERGPSPKHAVRVLYRATKEGAETYRRWIATVPEHADHVQMLARLAMAGPLGLGGVRIILKHYEQACLQEIDELDALEGHVRRSVQGVERLIGDLVYSASRERLEANRRWVAQARCRTDDFDLRPQPQ
jgi:DNA-binding PadR family transcriptional regulator